MIVNITQKDIDGGEACDPNNCPGARAINRRLKKKYSAEVGEDNITIFDDMKAVKQIKTPQKLTDFIFNYDSKSRKRLAKPMRFTLEIPAKYVSQNKNAGR